MKNIWMISLVFLAGIVLATEWKTVVVESGKAVDVGYNESGKPYVISPDRNEYPLSYTFPTNGYKYWKKVGDDWVAMSQVEQDAVDNVEAEEIAEIDKLTEREKIFFKALVRCINKRIPSNPITLAELKTEAKLVKLGQ